MLLGTIFFASLLMGFSGALMPGPLLTVTINESLRKGAKVGPQIILGHAILELILGMLILLGMGVYITLPSVKGAIGIIGGVFLLWMGYGILKETFSNKLTLNLEGEEDVKTINPILAGITVSASNPYWSIWWATAGASALMLACAKGVLGIVSFFSGHLLADLIWYSSVSFAVAKGKSFFTPVIYRTILGVCGVFLLALAIFFVYSGFGFINKL